MTSPAVRLFAIAALAGALIGGDAALAQQTANGWYRIPYNNGTRLKVTRDHTDHFSNGTLTTRVDIVGTGGSGEYAIVAAADGVIRMIEDGFDKRQDSGPGVTCNNNYVWIEHANGEWSKYSHMKKGSTTGPGSFGANRKVGDTVKAGDFLGWESEVGCASGDHLHFEIAEIGSTSEVSTSGGFVLNSANRIPRMCAVPGWRFRTDETYTSVGFGIPVYRDKNYDGPARAFEGVVKNYPDLHPLGFGDNISSILTACPEPLYAILYEHKNYGGRALYFNGTGINDTHAVGFGDNISSMRIYAEPQVGITVYVDNTYRGKSTFLTQSVPDLDAIGFDRNISSIFVYGQVEVELFEGKNYTGASRKITRFVRDTATMSKNDNIRSIRFVPPPFLVTRATYSVDVAERDTCPKEATITTEFETNQEGTVVYRRERQGGDPSDWISMKSERVGSKFIARKVEKQWVSEVDQTRRVKVKDGLSSAWTEFKVGCPPFRITDVFYSVRVAPGALCPRDLEVRETYITNGPGTFRHRRERQGGPPSDWVETDVKLDGTTYRAEFSSSQKVGELDQMRRVVARPRIGPLGEKESDWVHVKVDCIDILQSAVIYDGPASGTCRYRTDVRLRVNGDMEAEVPYRLDCTDGQSATGTFAIRKTGPSTFIGVDALKLNVTKTGKQICALKANVGAGFKNLTLQGKDFICEEALDAAVYIDGPAQGTCPAEQTVRVRFNARDNHSIPYGLKCSTGQSWDGTIKVAKTGPQTFIGVTTHKLKVTKTGKIACSLTSKLTGATKVIALRGKDFQCQSVSSGPVACRGGVVFGGVCRCPAGSTLRNGACSRPRVQ